MAGIPEDFDDEVRRDGDVVITHHGRRATVLRGGRAAYLVVERECRRRASRLGPALVEVLEGWGEELHLLRGS